GWGGGGVCCARKRHPRRRPPRVSPPAFGGGRPRGGRLGKQKRGGPPPPPPRPPPPQAYPPQAYPAAAVVFHGPAAKPRLRRAAPHCRHTRHPKTLLDHSRAGSRSPTERSTFRFVLTWNNSLDDGFKGNAKSARKWGQKRRHAL